MDRCCYKFSGTALVFVILISIMTIYLHYKIHKALELEQYRALSIMVKVCEKSKVGKKGIDILFPGS